MCKVLDNIGKLSVSNQLMYLPLNFNRYNSDPMKSVLCLLTFLMVMMAPVRAADDLGVIVRIAPVHADASSVSARIGQIPAGSTVSIFSRKGGWKEIFSEEKAMIGWVRSYQVREGNFTPTATVETKADSRGFLSGLASFSRKASGFFSSDTSSTSSGTATIGIRGLSEAEIKSAVADFEELEKMKSFGSNPVRMAEFSSEGRLRSRNVKHIAGKG
jgi:hypothetical protein